MGWPPRRTVATSKLALVLVDGFSKSRPTAVPRRSESCSPSLIAGFSDFIRSSIVARSRAERSATERRERGRSLSLTDAPDNIVPALPFGPLIFRQCAVPILDSGSRGPSKLAGSCLRTEVFGEEAGICRPFLPR